jgi:hypothetical protein
MAEIIERHRTTSRMVSRAELVDGNRHVEVVMAMTPSTLHYENADMQASLDLQWIHEIEYDNELATGQAVENGKVLRLRSNSQTFEFVLPQDVVPRWHVMLPPRRPIETPVVATGTGLAPTVANAS